MSRYELRCSCEKTPRADSRTELESIRHFHAVTDGHDDPEIVAVDDADDRAEGTA